jgi:hypothetical protein
LLSSKNSVARFKLTTSALNGFKKKKKTTSVLTNIESKFQTHTQGWIMRAVHGAAIKPDPKFDQVCSKMASQLVAIDTSTCSHTTHSRTPAHLELLVRILGRKFLDADVTSRKPIDQAMR